MEFILLVHLRCGSEADLKLSKYKVLLFNGFYVSSLVYLIFVMLNFMVFVRWAVFDGASGLIKAVFCHGGDR